MLSAKRILFVVVAVLTTMLTTLSLPAQAASVPGKPVAKLASGNARVVLSWVAPASNGSTITSYQAVARKYAAGKWQAWSYYNLSRTSRSKSVAYTNGTKVQAMVRAKNAKGFGSWSTIQSTVTGLPNAPASRSVTQGNKSLTVSWGAAAGNGSAITAYRVYYRSQVGGVWGAWAYATTSGSIRTKIFGSLTTGKKYQLYVRAANKWGYGSQGSTRTAVGVSVPDPPSSVVSTSNGEASAVSVQWGGPLRSISGGREFTCGLYINGKSKCWGGWLGYRLTEFNGLASGLTTVVEGYLHTCALLDTGGVQCWGDNSDGQVGNGSADGLVQSPTYVAGLTSGVKAISAGDRFTCALLETGAVQCWGANELDQLGNSNFTDFSSNVPITVAGLSSRPIGLTSGGFHTCALLDTGGVQCWGNNGNDQLGDILRSSTSSTPIGVTGLSSGVKAISSAYVGTCALLNNGGVKCWGSYPNGCEDFYCEHTPVPTTIGGLAGGVSALVAGLRHSCAVLTTGDVKCWGYNDFGQLGVNGSTKSSSSAVFVNKVVGTVQSITLGLNFGCALLTTGSINCWGDSAYGYLGNWSNYNSGQGAVKVLGISSNGGSPITSYAVAVVEDPTKSCTVLAPATTCTIAGLAPGNYTFTVTATNAVGTSFPSAPSNFVTIP